MSVFLLRGWLKGAEIPWEKALASLPLNLALLQSWCNFSAYSFNTPAWFLSSLMFCYFCFLWLGRFLHCQESAKRLVLAGIAFLAVKVAAELAAAAIDDPQLYLLLYVNPLSRVWVFAFGMVAGALFWRHGHRPGVKASAAQVLIFSVWAVSVCLGGMSHADHGWLPSWFVLLSALLVYSLSFPGVLASVFSAPWLVWLGNLSMECYFVHFPAIQTARSGFLRRLGMPQDPFWVGCLALGMTLAVAALLHEAARPERRRRGKVWFEEVLKLCKSWCSVRTLKEEWRFALGIVLYFGMALLLFAASDDSTNQVYMKKALCIGALGFAWLWRIFRYRFDFLFGFLLLLLDFLIPVFVKWQLGKVALSRELLGAFLLTSAFYFLFIPPIRALALRRGGCSILKGIVLFLSGAVVLWPLLIGGYYLATGQLLSEKLLYTLFQTNPEEAIGYLSTQNWAAWAAAFLAAVLISAALSAGLLFLVKKIEWSRRVKVSFFLLPLLGLMLLPGSLGSYALDVLGRTRIILRDYSAYAAAKELRAERLRGMRGIATAPGHGGVYMLVIGESNTRDHMSVYGYGRPTTPWLEQLDEKPGTLRFTHSYSNAVGTMESLSFALTQKNQYNDVALSEAYSIVDAAKAAGYKVYWISNQAKYGLGDMPVSEVAALADVQDWVSGEALARNGVLYNSGFDEEVAKHLPDSLSEDKVLIVTHLMGSHAPYADRIPGNYLRFDSGNRNVDVYDSSILYHDTVLKALYEKWASYPHAMGWIYTSDHGEEVEKGLAHNPETFTYPMARVPFIMAFSEEWTENNREEYEVLRGHIDAYWTNDLLYNAALSVMGIEGMPGEEPQLDIASAAYDRTKGNTLTDHGNVKIEGDVQ